MTDLPARLGRYEILKRLAGGGMTELLLGRASGLEGFERHVVIKRLLGSAASDRHLVKLFLDEARIAASLHHANIVQVHDVGEDAESYYLAMEYVHGEDLRTLIRQANLQVDQLPIEVVVTIGTAVASALHYAHEIAGPDGRPLGLVHRDIALSNILVGYDGGVKIVDFGIAKAALRSAETRTGTLRGKVSYMSPELCMGRHIDRRSDVYSLGIVLYELATGKRLFKTETDFLTMSAIVKGNIPHPSIHRPGLPADLGDTILRMLAVSPKARYQTAEELRAALERFAVAGGIQMSATRLSRYLTDLFGLRPEPWRKEAAPTVIIDDVSIGIVVPPTLAPGAFGGPDSPIAKAHYWAAHTDTAFDPIDKPPAPESDIDWTDDAAETILRPRTSSRIPVQTEPATQPDRPSTKSELSRAETAVEPATRPGPSGLDHATTPRPRTLDELTGEPPPHEPSTHPARLAGKHVPSVPSVTTLARHARRRWLAIAVAASTVALAALVVVATRRDDTSEPSSTPREGETVSTPPIAAPAAGPATTDPGSSAARSALPATADRSSEPAVSGSNQPPRQTRPTPPRRTPPKPPDPRKRYDPKELFPGR